MFTVYNVRKGLHSVLFNCFVITAHYTGIVAVMHFCQNFQVTNFLSSFRGKNYVGDVV